MWRPGRPTACCASAAGSAAVGMRGAVRADGRGHTACGGQRLAPACVESYAPRREARFLAAGSDDDARAERILNIEMRDAMQQGAPASSLRAQAAALDATIEQARVVGSSASDGKLFFDSFLIMLREGFEAILFLGALATYLLRTGHKAKAPLP